MWRSLATGNTRAICALVVVVLISGVMLLRHQQGLSVIGVDDKVTTVLRSGGTGQPRRLKPVPATELIAPSSEATSSSLPSAAASAATAAEFGYLATVTIGGQSLGNESIQFLHLGGSSLDGSHGTVDAVAMAASRRLAVTAWRVADWSDRNSMIQSKYFENITDTELCSVELFGVASHRFLSAFGVYTGADKLEFSLYVQPQTNLAPVGEFHATCRSNINDFRGYARSMFPNLALICTFPPEMTTNCQGLLKTDAVMGLHVMPPRQQSSILLSVWHARALPRQARPKYDLGVCVPMPFQNDVSGPTLAAFVKYYALMGFKVIVYDKYGAHRSFLSDWIDNRRIPELHYFPYTMEELMFPELPKDVEVDRGRRNIDKAATYSHCKHEHANVKNLLIVDYDEFLYCSNADGVKAQKEAIASTFSTITAEELMIMRKHLTNSTEDIVGCAAAAKADDLESLFKCYQQQLPNRTKGAPKAMSPSAACPFFWVHGACNQARSLHCKCHTNAVKGCQLVHLNHGRFATGSTGGLNPLLGVVSQSSNPNAR